MRKEIVAAIKAKLETELSIPVYTYQPAYSKEPVKFPHAVVEIGSEQANDSLSNKSLRYIPVMVLIVNQSYISQGIEKGQNEIYDLADTCDSKLNNYQFSITNPVKSPKVKFDSVDWYKEMDSKDTIIYGASVNFNCITTR